MVGRAAAQAADVDDVRPCEALCLDSSLPRLCGRLATSTVDSSRWAGFALGVARGLRFASMPATRCVAACKCELVVVAFHGLGVDEQFGVHRISDHFVARMCASGGRALLALRVLVAALVSGAALVAASVVLQMRALPEQASACFASLPCGFGHDMPSAHVSPKLCFEIPTCSAGRNSAFAKHRDFVLARLPPRVCGNGACLPSCWLQDITKSSSCDGFVFS